MVIWDSSMSLERKKMSPLFTFLMKKLWSFPPHTIIACDMRVCHETESNSCGQIHGNCKENAYIYNYRTLSVMEND